MSNTFDRVKLWNKKVGNTPAATGTKDYWVTLENQYQRIAEELEELYEAIVNRDIKEVCDAGGDLDVVVSGFNYLSGSSYGDLINTILENNELKYTTDKGKAENWLTYQSDNGVKAYIHEEEVEGTTYYCIRRESDNKVLKFGNFPKVDITEYLPVPVEENLVLVKTQEDITKELSEYTTENNLPILELSNIEGDQNSVFEKLLDEHGTLLLVIVNTGLKEVRPLADIKE